jgi:SAM-dependent methyltransferase
VLPHDVAVASNERFECRNCRGHESHSVYEDVPDRFQGFDGAFTYVQCNGCGLVQLEHMPEDPGIYYRNYRLHHGPSRLMRAAAKALVGHCYFTEPGHGKTMLDFGCGNGIYMQDMQKLGWKPSGYEFDPSYAAELERRIGLPVLSGEGALAAHEGAFDLLTFNFSFEHLAEPLHMLQLAARCVRPGGQIYIVVPNIEGREAKIFKDHWFHLDPPRHLTFFTKDMLRSRLEEAGFFEIATKDQPVPTGFAGSVSYRLFNRYAPFAIYAGTLPGLLFSCFVRDGNFAITARRN